ncbi:hypothetical protein GCM10009819_00520 [Agromyces tropicus]|uniref:Uncharacterized protein n=1 Tax=Agromyces tropicus TaxID=555371 RepID=A0ABP5FC84_9MICO
MASVAGRFAEWLDGEWRGDPGRSIRVWCTSGDREVRETADLLVARTLFGLRERDKRDDGVANWPFDDDGAPGAPASGPARADWMPTAMPSWITRGRDPATDLGAYRPNERSFRELVGWLNGRTAGRSEARRTTNDAPLVVGNEPLIGWLASAFTRTATPVARGELVCLVRETGSARWRVTWTVSDDGPEEADEIRAKVKSKMTTAASLGTVIIGLTTFLLQGAVVDPPHWFEWAAFIAFGASAGLYFATLFLYDSLLMPTRFWGSRGPQARHGSRAGSALARLRHGRAVVRRPPSAAAVVLQMSMTHVWTWIFLPATILAGLGVTCLGVSLVADVGSPDPAWHVLLGVVPTAVIAALWVAWHRPNMGVTD